METLISFSPPLLHWRALGNKTSSRDTMCLIYKRSAGRSCWFPHHPRFHRILTFTGQTFQCHGIVVANSGHCGHNAQGHVRTVPPVLRLPSSRNIASGMHMWNQEPQEQSWFLKQCHGDYRFSLQKTMFKILYIHSLKHDVIMFSRMTISPLNSFRKSYVLCMWTRFILYPTAYTKIHGSFVSHSTGRSSLNMAQLSLLEAIFLHKKKHFAYAYNMPVNSLNTCGWFVIPVDHFMI